MQLSKMKEELTKYSVDFGMFLEKSEFVDALAGARVSETMSAKASVAAPAASAASETPPTPPPKTFRRSSKKTTLRMPPDFKETRGGGGAQEEDGEEEDEEEDLEDGAQKFLNLSFKKISLFTKR